MKKNKNNFTRAVEWLRAHGVIKDQKDMAGRMGVTPNTISRNKHEKVKRADEETLHKFNAIFGDIINIAYLRGDSDVMLVADLQKQDTTEINGKVYTCSATSHQKNISQDISNMMSAVIAAKDEIIAALRNQLTDKDALIESKERYIKILQQQIFDLHNLKRSQDDVSLVPVVTEDLHK